MRRWLPIRFLVVALALIGGTGGHSGTNEKKDAQPKPDFTLTAEALAMEFSADAKAAVAKYDNKRVELTGVVDEVTSTTFFTLKGAKKGKNDLIGIRCEVSAKYAPQSAYLSQGQKVKVASASIRYADFTQQVELGYVMLTELEPTKLVITPALDLAKEFEKDEMAVRSKYEKLGPNAGVSGTVEELIDEGVGFKGARLSATANVKVVVSRLDLRAWEALKKGQHAEFRGRYIVFRDKKIVDLDGAILLKTK